MKTIRPELELVADAGDWCGETPVWYAAEQALYWINCENPPVLRRWAQSTGERRDWPMPQRIGGMVLKEGGGALAVLADGLYDLDLATGGLSLRVANPMDHAALHECACDGQGRLWVGGIDHRVGADNPSPCGATLFRLERNELVPVLGGISCSNGLAISPDGRTLYHSDSPTGRIDAYDLAPDGSLSNGRLLAQLSPEEGFCDGSTVDAEGGYWATLVFGGKLRRYLPDGTLDIEVELPFPNPTKLAFGGADMGTLFITTTRMSMGAVDNAMNGGVYAFRPGVKGRPETMLAA